MSRFVARAEISVYHNNSEWKVRPLEEVSFQRLTTPHRAYLRSTACVQYRTAELRSRGVDVSPWAVTRANARLGGPVCRVLDLDRATPRDFSVTYDAYDAVVMHNVLEHVNDPDHLLTLGTSLLNPGGFLFCATLNADSLFHKALGPNWVGYSDPSHRSPWLTASWLTNEVREKGLELIEFELPKFLWAEDTCDLAVRELGAILACSPAGQLLQDGWGDIVELIARKPQAQQISPSYESTPKVLEAHLAHRQ